MSPIKLILIAILVYIGYRLLLNQFRSKPAPRKEGSGERLADDVNDVLVEDPVCHTLIPRSQAVRLHDDDEHQADCRHRRRDESAEEDRHDRGVGDLAEHDHEDGRGHQDPHRRCRRDQRRGVFRLVPGAQHGRRQHGADGGHIGDRRA